jgi:hypothetical protein
VKDLLKVKLPRNRPGQVSVWKEIKEYITENLKKKE